MTDKDRPIIDDFNGDNAKLIESARALISLNDSGSLAPHGIGGHARAILSAFIVRMEAAALSQTAGVPDVLFDGYAVYQGMTEEARARINAGGVSDVLDSVVRLIRAAARAASGGEAHPDALPDGTLSKSTAKRVEAMAAASVSVAQRLRDAIEGECDGLGITEESAESILRYIGFHPQGRIVGGREIDGVWVIEATSHSDLMPNQQLVRYEDYMRATTQNPPQLGASVSERAREILASQYESDGFHRAAKWMRDSRSLTHAEAAAIRAIEQALTQQRGDDQVMLPAGWYAFVHDCAQMRGMEVNGNRLSMKAADLLAAATTPQPSADAVRELVKRWRDAGNACVEAGSIEGALANNVCADELESLLSGGSRA